eukprot:499840-Rhodomonas_salina.3
MPARRGSMHTRRCALGTPALAYTAAPNPTMPELQHQTWTATPHASAAKSKAKPSIPGTN